MVLSVGLFSAGFPSLTLCVHSVIGPDSEVSPQFPTLLCIVLHLAYLDCPSNALPEVSAPPQLRVSPPGRGILFLVKPVRVFHCTCCASDVKCPVRSRVEGLVPGW